MSQERLELNGDARYIRKWPQSMGRFVKYYTVTAKSTHALSFQLFALVWFSKL